MGRMVWYLDVTIFDCLEDIKTDDSYVVIMCPSGELYSQKKAESYSKKNI